MPYKGNRYWISTLHYLSRLYFICWRFPNFEILYNDFYKENFRQGKLKDLTDLSTVVKRKRLVISPQARYLVE